MPIEGRSPRECAEAFRSHVSSLLAATIATDVPLLFEEGREDPQFAIVFRRGAKPVTVPLKTKFGKLHFYLAQLVEGQKDGSRYRLRTLAYWYRLQRAAGTQEPALLRWEYDRKDPRVAGPPRHHVQLPATIDVGSHSMDFDKLHTPSGWVTIEEMIRFLIHELGVAPLSDRWPEILAESEDKFFLEFSGKRAPKVQVPPAKSRRR